MLSPLTLLDHHMTIVQLGLAVVIVYTVSAALLGIYRLYLHPLRNIPGPKLAAATQWVETYYECFKAPGGQFMWQYQNWHKKYGPIVRISPNEVHIQDPYFYETLYAQSRHSDKLKHLEHRFNNSTSSFATAEHSKHRVRRGALNSFFSKRTISQYSVNIQAHMYRLCQRLSTEYRGTSTILNLNNMWGAFTSDITVGYCLEQPYDFILNPNFRAEFSDAMVSLLDPVHFITQFPWMIKSLQLLPDWLIQILSPAMSPIISFNKEMETQIIRAKTVHASGENLSKQRSLFTALLETDLPPAELSTRRLQHEAISVIGAGIETTMYALSTCSYHLLANPTILEKLQNELQAAIPNPDNVPHLDQLMQLPYLTAVISEALRFAYGTPQRIPRLAPGPIVYKDFTLPVGTIVSMDNYWASHDSSLFPDPYAFRPERWEGNPTAPDGKALSRYMVAFGRGTRSCVGMQLAYADLYIGLATFFRKFDCVLFETDRDAVDVYMDRFVPRPKPGTHGVQVKVLG